MSNDNTNSTIDEEIIGKQHQYKGPRKLVWEDGRQVMRNLEFIKKIAGSN
jgi:hypothetical protein